MSGPRIAHSWGYGPTCMAYTNIPFQHDVGMKFNAYSRNELGPWNLQVICLPEWDGSGVKPNHFTYQAKFNPLTSNPIEYTRVIPISFVDNDGDEVVIDFIRATHIFPETSGGGVQDLPWQNAWNSQGYTYFPGIITCCPNFHPAGSTYQPEPPIFGMGTVPPTWVGAGYGFYQDRMINGTLGAWIGSAYDIPADNRVVILPMVTHPVEGSFIPGGYVAMPKPDLIGNPSKGLVIQSLFNPLPNLRASEFDDGQEILDARDANVAPPLTPYNPPYYTPSDPYYDMNSLANSFATGQVFSFAGLWMITSFGPAGDPSVPNNYYPGFNGPDAPYIVPTMTPAPGQPLYSPIVTPLEDAAANPTPGLSISFTPNQEEFQTLLDSATLTAEQEKSVIDIDTQSPQSFESNDIMPTSPEYTGPSIFGDNGIWGDFRMDEYLSGAWNPSEDPAQSVAEPTVDPEDPNSYDPGGSAGGWSGAASGYEDDGDWQDAMGAGAPWW